MTPEKPQESQDKKADAPRQEYLREAERLRTKLLPQETEAKWQKVLDLVANPPTLNEDKLDPLKHAAALGLQKEMHETWLTASKALNAATAILQGKSETVKDLDDVQKKTVLRHVAKYLQARQQFERIVFGKDDVLLTPLLAPFVELNEEELAAEKITDRLLPLQYDVKRNLSLPGIPKEIANRAPVILLSAMRQKLKANALETIVKAIQTDPGNDDAHKKFLVLSGFGEKEMTPENINAVKLLAGYVAKDWKNVETFLQTSEYKTLDTLPIDQALLCLNSFGAGAALQEIATQTSIMLRSGSMPDMGKILEKAEKSGAMFSERAAEAALGKFVPIKTPDDKAQFRKDAAATISLSRESVGEEVPLNSMSKFVAGKSKGVQAMTEGTAKEMMSRGPEFRARILKSCFLTPNGSKGDLYREMDRALTKLLDNGDAKFRTGFELYCMLEQGDRATVMLPLKVQDLLLKNDETGLSNSLEAHLISAYADLAKKALSEEDLNVALDAYELSPRQKTEMSNAAEYLRDEGAAKIEKWWDKTYKLFKENPWLLVIVAPTALWGGAKMYQGARGVLRFRTSMQMRSLSMFATMTAAEVDAHSNKLGIPVEQIRTAQAEVTKLLTEYDLIQEHRFGLKPALSLSITDKAREKYGIKKEALAIRDAFMQPAELNDLAKALKSRYGMTEAKALAETLAPLAQYDAAAIEKALTHVGYGEAEAKSAAANSVKGATTEAPKAEIAEPPTLAEAETAKRTSIIGEDGKLKSVTTAEIDKIYTERVKITTEADLAKSGLSAIEQKAVRTVLEAKDAPKTEAVPPKPTLFEFKGSRAKPILVEVIKKAK